MIGLFLSTILGSFPRDGVVAGIVSVSAYGAGMGMLVVALTVTLAFAQTGLSTRLRSASRHIHTAAGAVVVLSGAYLAGLWYNAIFRPLRSTSLTTNIGAWQTQLSRWLQERGASDLALTLDAVIFAGVAFVGVRRLNSRGAADTAAKWSSTEPDDSGSPRDRRRAS